MNILLIISTCLLAILVRPLVGQNQPGELKATYERVFGHTADFLGPEETRDLLKLLQGGKYDEIHSDVSIDELISLCRTSDSECNALRMEKFNRIINNSNRSGPNVVSYLRHCRREQLKACLPSHSARIREALVPIDTDVIEDVKLLKALVVTSKLGSQRSDLHAHVDPITLSEAVATFMLMKEHRTSTEASLGEGSSAYEKLFDAKLVTKCKRITQNLADLVGMYLPIARVDDLIDLVGPAELGWIENYNICNTLMRDQDFVSSTSEKLIRMTLDSEVGVESEKSWFSLGK